MKALPRTVWEALDVLERLEGHLWKSPSNWNSQTQRFEYTAPSPYNQIGWKFAFLCSVFEVVACGLLVTLQLYGIIYMSIFYLLIVVVSGQLVALSIALELGSIYWTTTISVVLHEMKNAEEISSKCRIKKYIFMLVIYATLWADFEFFLK